MHDMVTRDRTKTGLILTLAVVVLYIALAWPGLHGPFVFDDLPNLEALSKTGPIDTWRSLGMYLSEARGFPGRPLAMLSFVPQQGDWPGNPFPFKLVNLALHLLNAGLLFVLFRRIAGAFLAPASKGATLIAAVAATAWLVHPMQLSTVFLVIQRMTLLSTLFILVGLSAYLHGLLSTQLSNLARATWMGAGIGLFGVLAILCKETGLLLPVFALAIDATVLRRYSAALPSSLRIWRAVLLYTAPVLLAAYIIAYQPGLHEVIPIRNFTVAERLLTESRVLMDYVGKIALPRYAQFGIYNDDFIVSRGLFAPWTTAVAMAVVLGSLVFAFAKRATWPLAAFAIFWYLGGQSMESGPIPLELYFEHRNYLPMAGPILALAIFIARLPEGTGRRIAIATASLWLVAGLFATALYAQVWSNPSKLAYFWASSHPGSTRAQGDYAELLFRSGDALGSLEVMAASAERNPDDVGAQFNVLLLHCLTGQASPQQVATLRAQATRARWSALAYQSLSSLQAISLAKQCPAVDGDAWLSLSDALVANPAFQADQVAMGNLHYQRHALFMARGQVDLAIAELEKTATLDPDPEIVRLEAKYLADAGRYDEAIANLRHFDSSKRPLLRRLLVDDDAINREFIATLTRAKAQSNASGAAD